LVRYLGRYYVYFLFPSLPKMSNACLDSFHRHSVGCVTVLVLLLVPFIHEKADAPPMGFVDFANGGTRPLLRHASRDPPCAAASVLLWPPVLTLRLDPQRLPLGRSLLFPSSPFLSGRCATFPSLDSLRSLGSSASLPSCSSHWTRPVRSPPTLAWLRRRSEPPPPMELALRGGGGGSYAAPVLADPIPAPDLCGRSTLILRLRPAGW
jgi:hypothetical protein